jgi:hypothetical protein
MGASNFVNLPTATLIELRDAAVQAQLRIMETGQSHTVSGRTFTQASLNDLSNYIGELNAAIAIKQRKTTNRTLTNFNVRR